MTIDHLLKLEKKHIMGTYSRANVLFEKGEGLYLFDSKGKGYLDLIGAIGCAVLGHANKEVADALSAQAKHLLNATNLYHTKPQIVLAKRLSELSGLDKSFFSNSGTEANEAAIKLARGYTGRSEIIVANNAFHGRTFGSLAATGKEGIKKGFYPMLQGFCHVNYNSIDAIQEAITEKTAAVMLEPIQGEAGVNVPYSGYLKDVSALCKNNGLLLILDEIQTGNGRTGEFFAFQHEGIKPDIATIAKGLANGVPIGATIANEEIAECFGPGTHGSTFGGNSLSCAAANATIDFLLKNGLMQNARQVGAYFSRKLNGLPKESVKEVRGKGLMLAMDITESAKELASNAMDEGLLVNACNEHTIRFLPPLMISKKEVDTCISILEELL